MKNLFGNAVLLTLAVILLAGCGSSNAIEVGDQAPDFTLSDADGRPVTLSAFSGKVIVLDFFASWCPPCRIEIPDFIKLQNEYGNKGFTMVGVSLVSPKDTKEFASQSGINYPVAVDNGKVSAAYGPIRSIPTTFVIGKDGRVAKVYIGYRPKDIFEKDIKELLK